MAKREPLDWARIGRNVRQARIIRGYSQAEFADHAGISITTLFHAERGIEISHRSLLKICAALEESFDSIRTRNRILLTDETEFLLFRWEQALWTVELETRSRVPEDDLLRIQDPEERRRLGTLGLVPVFFCTTSFIMPEGPGMVFIELYGRLEDPFNAIIYRDCLLSCTHGRARVRILDREFELGPGDVVGYRSKNLVWMEAMDGPAHLVWTGAVRVGSVPREIGSRERVKRKGRSSGRSVFRSGDGLRKTE